MSFFTALLDAAGGFGAGRQQRLQNQQNQQTLDQEQQYRTAEEKRQDAQLAIQQAAEGRAVDAAQRNKGIDPNTNRPFLLPPSLSQVAPGNKGKAATDQQTLAHLYAYANWLTQNGETDLAATTLDRAKAMEADIRSANSLTLRQNIDTYNQGQMDQRTADEIRAGITRTGMNNQTSLATNENTVSGANLRNQNTVGQSNINNLRTTQTSATNNANRVAQQYTAQASNDLRQMHTQNADAVREGKPTPYPNLDTFDAGLSYAIGEVAKDPRKLPEMLKNIDANASKYNPQMLIYAKRQLQDAARDAAQPAKVPIVPIGGYVPTAPPIQPPPP